MAGEHTRKRILDNTTALLLIKGYDGTRTKDISDRAGVSEATIFKYFKTKEDLLKTIVVSMIDKFTAESKAQISSVIMKNQSGKRFTYATLLKQIIAERMNYFFREDKLIKILVREMLINPQLRKLFIETIYSQLTNIFEIIILKGIEAGEFKRDTAAKIMKDTIFGLIIYNAVIQPAIDSKTSAKAEEISDILIRSLVV